MFVASYSAKCLNAGVTMVLSIVLEACAGVTIVLLGLLIVL